MTLSVIAKKAHIKSSKKKTVPAVFIVTGKIADDINKKHIQPLLEGLSHLDVDVIGDDYRDINKAISDSDIIVLLDKNEEILKLAWSQGVVPVTQAFNRDIQDYNPNTESGNAFIYKNVDKWEIFAAVVRALETHKFPYDWKFIKRSCMKLA
ncbi:hypothetical protein KKD70_04735 [Patescibacteria group bacterium]|nr:hypothetical protein [Patescibacteria group bacterium]